MKNIFLFLSVFLLTAYSAYSQNNNDIDKGEPITSIFKGKNLVTFGNSITAAGNSWAYKVSKKLEFGNLYNGSVGGAVWSKRKRTSGDQTITTQDYNVSDFSGISNKYSPNPDIDELQKRINNCAIVHIQKYLSAVDAIIPDIIMLSYGTNDSFDTTMGDAESVLKEKDLTKVDLFTMAGALRWSIETLQARFPNAKLYIALPIQSARDTKNNGNLKKIAIIKKICDGMSVTYFDCYTECGITKENSGQYLRDGLHPNEEGNTVHANYIIRKLKEVYR